MLHRDIRPLGGVAETMDLDEYDWIEHRIRQLQKLRRLIDDDRALEAIDDLIAEAEERLERIAAEERSS